VNLREAMLDGAMEYLGGCVFRMMSPGRLVMDAFNWEINSEAKIVSSEVYMQTIDMVVRINNLSKQAVRSHLEGGSQSLNAQAVL
jgi:hypothetical protein